MDSPDRIELGKITFRTQTPSYDSFTLPEDLYRELSIQIETTLKRRLQELDEYPLEILEIKHKRGCIETEILIGLVDTVVGTVATVGAYSFVKDYDKIRSNLLSIFKDSISLHCKINDVIYKTYIDLACFSIFMWDSVSDRLSKFLPPPD